MAAPAQPIIPVVETAPLPAEEIEEESLTEIEAVSEQVALHSIESEMRHEEILEQGTEVLECLHRLETSSTNSEHPVTQAMATEITSLKTEVAEVKGMLVAIQASLVALNRLILPPSPNESTGPNPKETPPVENPAEQRTEELIGEPAPEETQRRKHRML